MNNNNLATDPYGLMSGGGGANGDDEEYFRQFEEFLTRYYIGISDLRGHDLLVDQGLP
ncbi:MAG: hypothetical protein NY202_02980 [Mollicutes bacterium UO1]